MLCTIYFILYSILYVLYTIYYNHGVHYSCGIPEKLLEKQIISLNSWETVTSSELLKHSWNIEIYFQCPGKLQEKQIISLYFWKTPGI